jgi:hypothetical protein
MPVGVGTALVLRADVLDHRLPVVDQRAVIQHEQRDRVGADREAHLLAVAPLGRDLLRHEVDAVLGQRLTDPRREGAPLGLIQGDDAGILGAG